MPDSKTMGIDQKRYEAIKIVDANGKTRVTRGTGDAVSNALLGLTEQQVYDVACDNGLKEKADGYSGRLNPGQVRMNIGNLLRGKLKKGENIVVLGRKITKLDQVISIKDKLAPTAKAKAAKATTAKAEPVAKAPKTPGEPKAPRKGRTLKDRQAALSNGVDNGSNDQDNASVA